MKTLCMLVFLALAGAISAGAVPIRVAVLEFTDQTGMASDARLGGAIAPGAMAQKGVFLLGKQLAGSGAFDLIDRRDFISQIEKSRTPDMAQPSGAHPSFLHAAQALRADVVLRGSLLSLSTGKQTVNQGGYATEFATLSARVGLEALSATDGAVIAAVDGASRASFRQTEATHTTLSEDDVLNLMEQAIAEAVPSLTQALEERAAQDAARPRIKFSIKTTEDPALVSIDGILVGSSPIENLEIYQGDHVLNVSKPGYQQITKRILFEKDTSIEVPMLRVQLSAEELKDIYEKGQLMIFQGAEPALIIKTVD